MLDKVYNFIFHKHRTQSVCLCVTHRSKHAYSVTSSDAWCFHLSIKVYTNLHKNLATLNFFVYNSIIYNPKTNLIQLKTFTS